ncbi:MAG: ClbS/DfsB family four-helix bundle protein [Anaerolineae bacterium]|nr:ClbS/DfsB family four-helix bundle protein [Anaerolineae bacterium]
MSRPTNKSALLAQSQQEYDALNALLANYSDEELCQPGAIGAWSAKDALAHLHAWHLMLLGWMADERKGLKPALPAPGYKWSETPALNQSIHERYQNHALEDVRALLADTHQQMMALIESLSQEQLYTAGHFAFTGRNNLATHLISSTSSHYLWARNEARRGLRRLFDTPR